MPAKKDLSEFVNMKFNLLLFIQEVDPHITKGGHKHRVGLFKCDCGVEKKIQISDVLNNACKSCGCYSKKNASKRMSIINFKHGKSEYPEYKIWTSMKKRCLNKNNPGFKNYGARGIFVCDEWINSFESFINYMGHKPTKNHSIERIDNNDGYYPKNCKWATKKEQANNQRSNVLLTAFGKEKSITEWSRVLNFSSQKLSFRLFKAKNKYSLIEMLKEINYNADNDKN